MSNQKSFRSFLIWSIAALILIIGILIVVKLTIPDSSSTDSANSVQTLPEKVSKIRDREDVRGNRLAKTVLIEYSDFQCPACAVASGEVNKLFSAYGDRIAIVYRHFPLPMHPNSVIAAVAAEAAGRQGKFWEMNDILFSRQSEWSSSADPLPQFVSYATNLGLDTVQFKKDCADPAVKNIVTKASIEARELGLDHTPTFFLNGRELVNIIKYEDFQKVIDQSLAKD